MSQFQKMMTTATQPQKHTLFNLFCALAAGLVVSTSIPAIAQTQPTGSEATPQSDAESLDSSIQLLRKDLRADKVGIVANNLQLTQEEAGPFWTAYKQYELELTEINDGKVDLIKDYAESYATLDNKKADELTARSLQLEEARTSLKGKYFKEFSKILPGTKVARFFQIDNRIDLLINVQLASELPLVEPQ